MQVDRQKFVDVGHHDLFTSSIPFAMERLSKEDRVRSGDLGLIINIGAGVHVGCAIYQF
jgi:3-oxoacyl-[acyl-carrier-protein] synthase III